MHTHLFMSIIMHNVCVCILTLKLSRNHADARHHGIDCINVLDAVWKIIEIPLHAHLFYILANLITFSALFDHMQIHSAELC